MVQVTPRAILRNGLICADSEWVGCLGDVFRFGNRTAPRGMLVYELLCNTTIVSMQNPIIYNPTREVGYKFMAAEAAWILDGRDDLASIAPYSKDIHRFSDDGVSFFGAYGPKIADQFYYIVDTLAEDQDSRQAVISIWRENPPKTKDVPCTISLQFLIREGKMHCVATMRSSDLWLGHVYDTFTFSAVAYAIAIQLSRKGIVVELGNLYLTCGSKHIYERNLEKVGEILDEVSLVGIRPTQREPVFITGKYTNAQDFIYDLWDAANSDKGALIL